MPQTIDYIDAIARRLQRDVLYITFERTSKHAEHGENFKAREDVLKWMDSEGIGWEPCGPYARENVFPSYAGEVYVDVPFDEGDPQYRKLQAFLEFPDGTARFANIKFYVLSLAFAMKNAHHDEPGFWERRAEDF